LEESERSLSTSTLWMALLALIVPRRAGIQAECFWEILRGIGTRPTVSKPQAPCGTGSFSIIVDPYPPSLRGVNSFAAGASARYSSSKQISAVTRIVMWICCR
jgi:hypothetical protein